MYTNGKVTHIAKNGYQSNTYDAYVEEHYTSSSDKQGDTKHHSLFVSIPTTESLSIQLGDLIILGEHQIVIDSSSEKNEAESIRSLKRNHRLYTVNSLIPCMYGHDRVKHYELGCD